jgi:hypothetical protein
MYEFVTPHWDNLVNGSWAESIASGRLSIEQMQGWILQLYPFIYDFPKFLAEGLIKVEDDFARTFLIENIRIEKAHAEHWLWMGEGFGLSRRQMLDLTEGEALVLRDVQSLTDWVWREKDFRGLRVLRESTRGEHEPEDLQVDTRAFPLRRRASQIRIGNRQALCHYRAHAAPGHVGGQAQSGAAQSGAVDLDADIARHKAMTGSRSRREYAAEVDGSGALEILNRAGAAPA